MSLPCHAGGPVATVWVAIFRRLRDFVGLRPPTSLDRVAFEARRAEGGISRRAGREERCDDREAPDEAKRNRHVPWGTDAKRRGGKGMIIPEPTRKAPAKQTL
ncbi:MAG: hypothetical protein II047_08505 [Bacteroidales bacterium]|nr:hypothetical protein [Bacteroidales bacterium]